MNKDSINKYAEHDEEEDNKNRQLFNGKRMTVRWTKIINNNKIPKTEEKKTKPKF